MPTLKAVWLQVDQKKVTFSSRKLIIPSKKRRDIKDKSPASKSSWTTTS